MRKQSSDGYACCGCLFLVGAILVLALLGLLCLFVATHL